MADDNIPTVPGTPPAGNPPAATWYGTPDTETLGYMQARGYDKMTPDKAAIEAMKAHREAEKLIGAPAEQLLRLPKDASDLDGWNKVHARLGVPAEAKDYDISAVKRADGSAVADEEAAVLKTIARELNLPKDVAPVFVQKLVKLADEANAKMDAEYTALLAVERDTLAKNWGTNAANFKVVAENAAKAMGFDEDMLATLERNAGYAKVMEGFRQIGMKTGEDKFVTGASDKSAPITHAEATYRLLQLENDTIWWDKFQKGDAATQTEFNNLTRIRSGG